MRKWFYKIVQTRLQKRKEGLLNNNQSIINKELHFEQFNISKFISKTTLNHVGCDNSLLCTICLDCRNESWKRFHFLPQFSSLNCLLISLSFTKYPYQTQSFVLGPSVQILRIFLYYDISCIKPAVHEAFSSTCFWDGNWLQFGGLLGSKWRHCWLSFWLACLI